MGLNNIAPVKIDIMSLEDHQRPSPSGMEDMIYHKVVLTTAPHVLRAKC
jgi:hypothetical protein